MVAPHVIPVTRHTDVKTDPLASLATLPGVANGGRKLAFRHWLLVATGLATVDRVEVGADLRARRRLTTDSEELARFCNDDREARMFRPVATCEGSWVILW